MKNLKLLVLGLFLSNLTFGQVVKIQTGTTFSKLDWVIGNSAFALFNETLVGYSIFAGMDYFEKKYFNLSSNLGFIQKGGKETHSLRNESGDFLKKTINAKLDYITINTVLDIKYPIKNNISPFISFGPRFDYLINYDEVFDGLNEMDALKKYSIGLILGGGLKYDLSKIQIGLRADYYLNFHKITDIPTQLPENLGCKINDKTVILNLIIGFRL
ncbi:MAG: PorT family protein [Bacteroidales bacterium]|jgi:hypothetical protein|nr:PorT family protein [Bacteroidales bacterium]